MMQLFKFPRMTGGADKQACLTILFLPEFSGCLVENPSCQFAIRCGFSFHCHHPNHREFHRSVDNSGEPIDLLNQYRELKEMRRREYFAIISAQRPTQVEQASKPL